ncbi:MAG TPA: hypothetical protein VFQ54_04330, partial [Thermomicrobiales bacterium]|nr:hypothetical protein [Thermomicrobiales bacterium]
MSLPIFAGLPPVLLQASVMPTNPNENMAVSLAIAALTFVITIIIGRPIITYLRKRKMGKKIRIEIQDTHFAKAGIPTMGGIMFCASAAVITLIFNTPGRLSTLLPVAVLLA